MTLILIAVAKDASTYDAILKLLNANGVVSTTVEAPTIVLPSNLAQAMLFAEQIKPIVNAMKVTPGSNFSARIYEVELKQSLET
jgi:hypothetical protein